VWTTRKVETVRLAPEAYRASDPPGSRPVLFRLLFTLPLLALWTAAGIGPPAEASSLTVQGGTIHTGSWATQVDLSNTCGQDHRTLANGTDYGGTATEEACISLTADDVDVLTGAEVTFRAGEQIALGSGFSVASGASFRAVVGPEVAGSAFVESGHANAATQYWARFYVFPNELDLTGGESFLNLTASDASRDLELAVGLKRNLALAENRVFLQVVEDGGGLVSTEDVDELVLPDGWHQLELRWRASTGADDGLVEICVDDSPDGGTMCAELAGLDNDTGRIDWVRWGALEVPQGDRGTLYMDDFRAQLGGPIGPCETEQECP
jgi:hypothetical protein